MTKLSVDIQNFQSIGLASLKFETGITGIIGHSNSGKTAVIRAIKAALLNPSGSKRYIKHGHSKSSVSLQVENSPEITWERTAKASSYKIDNEPHERTGKTDAFEITNSDLGFVLDDNGAIVNIKGEWDNLFPFGRSDSEVFKIFEDIFAVTESDKIFPRLKRDEDSTSKQVEGLQIQLRVNENKVNTAEDYFADVDDAVLENFRDTLIQLSKTADTYNEGVRELRAVQNKIDSTEDIQIQDFDLSLANEYFQVREALSFLPAYNKFAGMDEITIQEFDFSLFNTYQDLLSGINYIKKNQVLLRTEFETKEFDFSAFNTYTELCKAVEEGRNCSKRYRELTAEIIRANQEVADAEAVLAKTLEEMGVCPLCDSDLSHKHE